jgi:hypothetical protein
MATNIEELVPNVMVAIDPENTGIISTEIAKNYLRAAVLPFNSLTAREFSITADVLDRDARSLEKRALIILAVREWLLAKSREYSLLAIKHSNVAGSTNLTGIEFATAKRVKELEAVNILMTSELGHVLRRLSQAGVMAGGGVSNLIHEESVGPVPPGPWWGGVWQ